MIDPGDTNLSKKQLLNEREYRENYELYGDRFRAGMGAEAVKELLQDQISMPCLRSSGRTQRGKRTKRVRIVKD